MLSPTRFEPEVMPAPRLSRRLSASKATDSCAPSGSGWTEVHVTRSQRLGHFLRTTPENNMQKLWENEIKFARWRKRDENEEEPVIFMTTERTVNVKLRDSKLVKMVPAIVFPNEQPAPLAVDVAPQRSAEAGTSRQGAAIEALRSPPPQRAEPAKVTEIAATPADGRDHTTSDDSKNDKAARPGKPRASAPTRAPSVAAGPAAAEPPAAGKRALRESRGVPAMRYHEEQQMKELHKPPERGSDGALKRGKSDGQEREGAAPPAPPPPPPQPASPASPNDVALAPPPAPAADAPPAIAQAAAAAPVSAAAASQPAASAADGARAASLKRRAPEGGSAHPEEPRPKKSAPDSAAAQDVDVAERPSRSEAPKRGDARPAASDGGATAATAAGAARGDGKRPREDGAADRRDGKRGRDEPAGDGSRKRTTATTSAASAVGRPSAPNARHDAPAVLAELPPPSGVLGELTSTLQAVQGVDAKAKCMFEICVQRYEQLDKYAERTLSAMRNLHRCLELHREAVDVLRSNGFKLPTTNHLKNLIKETGLGKVMNQSRARYKSIAEVSSLAAQVKSATCQESLGEAIKRFQEKLNLAPSVRPADDVAVEVTYTQAELDARVKAETDARVKAAVEEALVEERARARQERLDAWTDPQLERILLGDPVRDKAMRFIAQMLSPKWLLMRKVAAFEDVVFDTTNEGGIAGARYKLRMWQLMTTFLPEGIPGAQGPQLENLIPGRQPDEANCDPFDCIRPEAVKIAKELRAKVWGNEADIWTVAMTAGLPQVP